MRDLSSVTDQSSESDSVLSSPWERIKDKTRCNISTKYIFHKRQHRDREGTENGDSVRCGRSRNTWGDDDEPTKRWRWWWGQGIWNRIWYKKFTTNLIKFESKIRFRMPVYFYSYSNGRTCTSTSHVVSRGVVGTRRSNPKNRASTAVDLSARFVGSFCLSPPVVRARIPEPTYIRSRGAHRNSMTLKAETKTHQQRLSQDSRWAQTSQSVSTSDDDLRESEINWPE